LKKLTRCLLSAIDKRCTVMYNVHIVKFCMN
jgi:hypothetical protein